MLSNKAVEGTSSVPASRSLANIESGVVGTTDADSLDSGEFQRLETVDCKPNSVIGQ